MLRSDRLRVGVRSDCECLLTRLPSEYVAVNSYRTYDARFLGYCPQIGGGGGKHSYTTPEAPKEPIKVAEVVCCVRREDSVPDCSCDLSFNVSFKFSGVEVLIHLLYTVFSECSHKDVTEICVCRIREFILPITKLLPPQF
jgi:hypothetical protein